MAPMPAAALRPYQQGGLDTMCGPYAVVNAVRLVVEPHRRLQRAACAALFAELVDELVARKRLVPALIEGCGSTLMAKLLRRAGRWLRERHALKLRVERPFTGRNRSDPEELVPVLQAHLGQAGRAAILGTADHWTVARTVAERRLLLFDSNRRNFMRLGEINGCSLADRLYLPGTFLLGSSIANLITRITHPR